MTKITPYLDEKLEITTRVKDLLERLTTKEKFKLMSGFNSYWIPGIKRLKVPKTGLSDGPRGISYHSSFKKWTQFPIPKLLAATWDPIWSEKFGEAIAKEIRASGKHILLAPGINIDRTPLNGRTFEYFSEDPLFIREMVAPLIKSVQKQNVGACLKHYVANNQETNRRYISAEIDERTLREIYLKAFEQIIKEADPWCVMSCYNRVNGEYGSASKTLLWDLLVKEFGFSGFVMSDWGATDNLQSLEEGINAGLALEMPVKKFYIPKKMLKAIEHNKITLNRIDELIKRILTVMIKTKLFDTKSAKAELNLDLHHKIARDMAAQGMVLLKNDSNILPLNKNKIQSIAIVGANGNKKFGKFIYGGSAAVIPPFEITPLTGISKYLGKAVKIVKKPSEADVVLVITGLNHDRGFDTETCDRKSLNLPLEEEELILKTLSQNPNIVVILINGSPISMGRWYGKIPAILEAWYPGMMGGLALADILFGEVNPSGKLPITFPKVLEDSPAHKNVRTFPGVGKIVEESLMDALIKGKRLSGTDLENNKVYYDEGIYVGYRHFDTYSIDPLFEFGFGLSYTEFELSNFSLDRKSVQPSDIFHLTFDIKNIGNYDGAEVVQVYYSDIECSVDRPLKELLGFKKVFIKVGMSKKVTIELKASDFAYFDVNLNLWMVEPGEFKILVGTSSRKILFESIVNVEKNQK